MPDLDAINAELLAPRAAKLRPAPANQERPSAAGGRERPTGADHPPATPSAPAGTAAVTRFRKGKDEEVPEGAVAVDRRTGAFANPWIGTGSALIFFDWLAGALERDPEFEGDGSPAPNQNRGIVIPLASPRSSVAQGGYDLVPGGEPVGPDPESGRRFFHLTYSIARSTGLADLERRRGIVIASLPQLAGRRIYCRCEPGVPCHGDVLSLLANRPQHSLPSLRAALAVRWDLPVTFAWGNL